MILFAAGVVAGALIVFGLALCAAAKTPQDRPEVGMTREPAVGNSLSPDKP